MGRRVCHTIMESRHDITSRHTREGQRAKGRWHAGFSLVEELAVVAILTLVSVIMARGVPVAYQTYNECMDAANAQLLLSTTTTRLRDVLSVADPATIECGSTLGEVDLLNDGSSLTMTVLARFTSLETGYRTSIGMTDNGIYLLEEAIDPVMGSTITFTESGETKRQRIETMLVPRKAASGSSKKTEMKSEISSIAYEKDADHKGVFTVNGVRVVREDADGNKVTVAQAERTEYEVRLIMPEA